MKNFELTRKTLRDDNSVLVIPEGVTHIVAPFEVEDGVDVYDIEIREIHLPASCEVVDFDSFNDFFFSLKRIVVAPESKHFFSDEDGVLFSADRKKMIRYPANRDLGIEFGIYRIPDSVEEIASNCFCGTSTLKILYFGKNVKRLNACSLGNFMLFELDRIFIPPTITELQHHIFDVVVPDDHLYDPSPNVAEYVYPVGIVGGVHGSSIEEYCKHWNIEFIDWDENDVKDRIRDLEAALIFLTA